MLSEQQKTLLVTAADSADPTRRRQAAALARATGADADEARRLLSQGFLEVITPSFHLIPRGTAMASEGDFAAAYRRLDEATDHFTRTDAATLAAALHATPGALSALRMVVSLTPNELAVTCKLLDPDAKISGNAIKGFERSEPVDDPRPARTALVDAVVAAVKAVMDRQVLGVPPEAAQNFHSKLDHADARGGWPSVQDAAEHGVPYSQLLYQRYVGGAWRQVQDAYSEVKGDNVLELPLERLLRSEGIPHWRAPSGASGARATGERYGLNPGPDFVIPADEPAVIIESKVAEDGGTARDKAARIKNLARTGNDRGLVVCAVVDGKGWAERPAALLDVVLATDGRTYSLATLNHLLSVPEIAGLRGTVPPVGPDEIDGEEPDDVI